MTEEKINELEKNFQSGMEQIMPHIVGHKTAQNLIIDSFKEAIQALQQQEQVSLDDRLPEIGLNGEFENKKDNSTKQVLSKVYTEKEVGHLLITQRGNCYVAILSETKDQKLAELASKAPEPWSWRK